ncbi:MAG TPA: methyltransferase domain-containing protein [Candidatus Saccharibacteria bacterium]|nr:methyltransferase domain-containing protein [Candidatus Saccharibacteria bacterium]
MKKPSKPIPTSDVESLAIDQYSRQKWASIFIDQIRVNDASFKILDVGGYKGKTAEFQEKDTVIVCDLFDVEEKNYVKGDGRRLPFQDSEFGFVVTFDTYEHIPREGRDQFVQELLRVSKQGVILAAPFDNENGAVFQAEVDLNDYHIKLYGKDHPWLKEHIEYRIPADHELNELLDTLSVPYASLPSNDLSIWTLMQTIYFSIDLDNDLRGRVDDINRCYNKDLTGLDSTDQQAYRKIYFFSKDKDKASKIQEFINRQKNMIQEDSKVHFIAYALSVWGQKYRDVERYKDYLENEIKNLKAT